MTIYNGLMKLKGMETGSLTTIADSLNYYWGRPGKTI